MKKVLLNIITIIHLLFVLFVVITPFTNSNYFLLLHSIVVPFIILHWVCNDNTCCLTLVEKQLRKSVYGKVSDSDCITCKLIEPVYDFKNDYASFSKFIYISAITLWLISTGKLMYKYKNGEIQKLEHLFRI